MQCLKIVGQHTGGLENTTIEQIMMNQSMIGNHSPGILPTTISKPQWKYQMTSIEECLPEHAHHEPCSVQM